MYKSDFNIVKVITQPDKRKGRGKNVVAPPVKIQAEKLGLDVIQPVSLRNNDELVSEIKSLEVDFFVVVAYGKIIPDEYLVLPKLAPVNVHTSLLPKYRGAAPIQWAIYNGERETGVTVMLINSKMDEGDILAVERIPIKLEDSVYDVEKRLIKYGVNVLIKTLIRFCQGKIKPVVQSGTVVYAPLIKKDDGRIDWKRDALEIYNQIRAFARWPKSFVFYKGNRINILSADIVNEQFNNALPGDIVEISKNSIIVKCGNGALSLYELQREGKKPLPVKDFLSGFKFEKGTAFE